MVRCSYEERRSQECYRTVETLQRRSKPNCLRSPTCIARFHWRTAFHSEAVETRQQELLDQGWTGVDRFSRSNRKRCRRRRYGCSRLDPIENAEICTPRRRCVQDFSQSGQGAWLNKARSALAGSINPITICQP